MPQGCVRALIFRACRESVLLSLCSQGSHAWCLLCSCVSFVFWLGVLHVPVVFQRTLWGLPVSRDIPLAFPSRREHSTPKGCVCKCHNQKLEAGAAAGSQPAAQPCTGCVTDLFFLEPL